jgi:hypothetical protein
MSEQQRKPETTAQHDEEYKECEDCGNEFRTDNGELISDFAFHRLRGCKQVNQPEGQG